MKQVASLFLTVALILYFTSSFSQSRFDSLGTEFSTYWAQGFHVKSKDGAFDLKFGGRLMNDWAFYSQDKAVQDEIGKLYSGTEFRRARLFSSGLFYDNIKYKFQLDFAGGGVSFKDVYMEFTKLPVVGNLRIGHYFEPFGMEQNTSSKYITFLERSLNDVFTPGRNVGAMLHNNLIGERMSWALGAFRETGGEARISGQTDYMNYSARLTGTPLYKEKQHRIIHLGLAYSFRTPNNQTYIARSAPESHLARDYISTGILRNTKSVNQIGYEAALFWGPFSLQGEFNSVSVNQSTDTSQNSYLFNGYYGMASYFITGELRNYNTGNGTIGRTYPNKNFMKDDNGMGALELAVRYSGLDLNSNNLEGGALGNITGGINWYPNPSTKVMANYTYAHLKTIGMTHIYQMRFQVDF
jgi:phosphate-selective porin OprO/OprP